MSLLSANDLTDMRAAQGEAFWDTCKVLTESKARSATGQMVSTYTAGSAIACRFDPRSSSERRDGAMLVRYDAQVRLPLGTAITAADRVQITKRHGTALTTALTFQCASAPLQGATALTVQLLRVTT